MHSLGLVLLEQDGVVGHVVEAGVVPVLLLHWVLRGVVGGEGRVVRRVPVTCHLSVFAISLHHMADVVLGSKRLIQTIIHWNRAFNLSILRSFSRVQL